MYRKIRCDEKSGKFCKICWELNKAQRQHVWERSAPDDVTHMRSCLIGKILILGIVTLLFVFVNYCPIMD